MSDRPVDAGGHTNRSGLNAHGAEPFLRKKQTSAYAAGDVLGHRSRSHQATGTFRATKNERRLLGTKLRPASRAVAGKPRRLWPVSVACANLVSLQMVPYQFYLDRAPTRVGIGLGVVA